MTAALFTADIKKKNENTVLGRYRDIPAVAGRAGGEHVPSPQEGFGVRVGRDGFWWFTAGFVLALPASRACHHPAAPVLAANSRVQQQGGELFELKAWPRHVPAGLGACGVTKWPRTDPASPQPRSAEGHEHPLGQKEPECSGICPFGASRINILVKCPSGQVYGGAVTPSGACPEAFQPTA